jgi:hypothetical protein
VTFAFYSKNKKHNFYFFICERWNIIFGWYFYEGKILLLFMCEKLKIPLFGVLVMKVNTFYFLYMKDKK